MGTAFKTAWKLPRQVICYVLAVAALAFATVPGPTPYLKKHDHHHRPSRRSLIEFGGVSVAKQMGTTAHAKQHSAPSQAVAAPASTDLKIISRFSFVSWAVSGERGTRPVQLRLQGLVASRGPP